MLAASASPWFAVSAIFLLMISVLGVLVFIAEYSRDSRGPTLLLVMAVIWLEAGIAYLIGSATLEITSFLMAAIAFLFYLVIHVIARSSTKEDDAQ